MPRKKLSAPNVVLFAGPSPAISVHTTSNIKEVYGLQGFNFEMNSSKEDVYSAGTRAALSRQSLDPDSVSFDFSYNFSNFDNEKNFGFSVAESSGIIAPLLDGSSDERNFFLMITPDGQDAIGSTPSSTPCLGFGNATLSSYSFNAAVGAYPTSTVSFQAVDAAYYEDSDSQILPAINISTNSPATGLFTLPTASGNFGQRDPVLRPWDISVNLSGASGLFHNLSTACIQSVDINFDLGRENQICLGKKWRNESNIADSVPVNFSLEILAKDMVTGRLSNFNCETGNYRAIVTVKRPSCNGNGNVAAIFDLKGLTWENQNQSIDRGSDSTVTLNFQTSIGGANETSRGLFISDGGVIITVADEAERYALTGISPGQLVLQTDNSTTYRLLAPSMAQGGVFVSGGTQDGIYQIEGIDNGKSYYPILGYVEDDPFIYWDTDGTPRWVILHPSGDGELYYSTSDTLTPDLATDWKNASDDSPAGITVTSVTQGELDAGVTVAGAGSNSYNGTFLNATHLGVVSTGYTNYEVNVFNALGTWLILNIEEDTGYSATAPGTFPWEVSYTAETGDTPAPTVTRNDICAPNNWEVVS